MEDTEMIRHITEGRLEGGRICATESLATGAGPTSYFSWSGEVKALSTPGTVARVNHRLRGMRATVREEILPPGAIELSLGDGSVWVDCDPEDPDFGKSIDLRGMSTRRETMGWRIAPVATSQSSGVR